MKRIIILTLSLFLFIGCNEKKPKKRAIIIDGQAKGMNYHFAIFHPYLVSNNTLTNIFGKEYVYIRVDIYADDFTSLRGDEVIWKVFSTPPLNDSKIYSDDMRIDITHTYIKVSGWGTYPIVDTSPKSWDVPIYSSKK